MSYSFRRKDFRAFRASHPYAESNDRGYLMTVLDVDRGSPVYRGPNFGGLQNYVLNPYQPVEL